MLTYIPQTGLSESAPVPNEDEEGTLNGSLISRFIAGEGGRHVHSPEKWRLTSSIRELAGPVFIPLSRICHHGVRLLRFSNRIKNSIASSTDASSTDIKKARYALY